MKKAGLIFFLVIFLSLTTRLFGQSNISTPYCQGTYGSGQCNQPNSSNNTNNWINDFINDFTTSGANVNISNTNSGCNGLGNNYGYYGCEHYLAVTPGQTISCNLRSGIIFDQSFAIFVDWNQDNVFQNPGEMVAFTSNAPTANTWTTISFVVPSSQGNGTYRMRVRCAYSIGGGNITPCGAHSHGETEDYNIYIGTPPPGIITATASTSSGTVCAGQQVTLNAAYSGSTVTPTFTWTGPGSYSSTAQNPVITTTGQAQSGTYSLVLGNGACPANGTVSLRVVDFPTFTVTPSTSTICQNGKIFANTNFAPGTNFASYFFNWKPAPGAGIFSPLAPSTSITPLPLPATQSVGVVIYSVTVTNTALNCPVTKTLAITISNPFSPTLNLPPPLCNTSAQVQLTGNPPGGTWAGNSGIALGGLLTPSLASIGTSSVMYSVNVGSCVVTNTGNISISKYHTPALSSSLGLVCEKDAIHNLMNLVQDTVTGKWKGPAITQFRYFSPQGLNSGIYTFTYNTWSTPTANVCPDSIVYSVQVFNPPIPIISPIAAKCNNSPTIQLTANPAGGIWSSQSGVTAGGVQTPSVNTIGVNSVTYTAGQGTCVASSSATFHVSQYNTAAFSKSVGTQCANGPALNLYGIVQNTLGSWSGVNVTNNVFTPGALPTNTYTLTYFNQSTPPSTLCPAQNTLIIHVLNPQPPNINFAGPYCSKDGTVQLAVTPATGSWIPSVYLSPSGVFSPSLAAIGNNVVQYIIGTSTCNAEQKRNISVEAFVPAQLTTSQIADLCVNSAAISLQPYGMATSGIWSGDGLQGSTFNPGLSGAGKFVLKYSTASIPSALCPDESTLSVQVFSLAPPIVSTLGPFCNNASPAQLHVSPLGGIFEGNNNMAVSSAGLFIPSNAVIGANVVSYSISSGPCIAFAQSTIQVEKFISADINTSNELAFCRNGHPINLNSIAVNPGYYWSGTAVSGDMFDPAKANIGSNNVIVYNTYPAGNASLCPDSRTVQVRVDDIPTIAPEVNVLKGCSPVNVRLQLPNVNAGVAEWNVGDGSKNVVAYSFDHVYTTPGSYSIVLNYSLGACYTRTALDKPIVVFAQPHADFEFSKPELLISDPEVELINTTRDQENNKYVWFVESQGEFYNLHPIVSFPKAGTYKVTLTATSYDKQCTDERIQYIEVKNDFQVFIPNSFSPNHDKINDKFTPVFSPYGLDVKTYEMEIFDRWGQQIFHTNDVTKGWDGTFNNKGEMPVKEGTYVYRIRFRDLDGKSYLKVGNLTLLAGQ